MGIQKKVILASRKTYYTRSNPDPKPAVIVDNREQIGKNKKKKQIVNLETEVPLRKANSLPKELVSLSDIYFDFKFEQSLFKTKSETDLKDTIIDLVFTSFLSEK